MNIIYHNFFCLIRKSWQIFEFGLPQIHCPLGQTKIQKSDIGNTFEKEWLQMRLSQTLLWLMKLWFDHQSNTFTHGARGQGIWIDVQTTKSINIKMLKNTNLNLFSSIIVKHFFKLFLICLMCHHSTRTKGTFSDSFDLFLQFFI